MRGPNGSGKSTLMKMLASLSQPQGGSISIPEDARVHYIDASVAFRTGATVRDVITNWKLAFPKLESKHIVSIRNYLEFHAPDRQQANDLSSGEANKLRLFPLLCAFHKLWILDEPFVHLDHHMQHKLCKMMLSHHKMGGTIIFTSHTLPEHFDIPLTEINMAQEAA